MKPVKYKDLLNGKLFRICSERRPYYLHGERHIGPVRSSDRAVYKKYGESHSSTKQGKDIILAGDDLVFEYVNPTHNNRSRV